MKRLFVALTALCAACAPPAYHYHGFNLANPTAGFRLTPNDTCQRTDVMQGILKFLNEKIGKSEGPPARVISASGFTYTPRTGGVLNCHGTLQTAAGPTGPGIVDVSGEVKMDTDAEIEAYNVRDAKWESDAERERKEAAIREQQAALRESEAAQERREVRKYCANATPVACSYFTARAVERENRCVIYSSVGYTTLLYQLTMVQAGMTIEQAAELSARNAMSSQGVYPLPSADIIDLASKASKVMREGGFIDPPAFRAELLTNTRLQRP